MNRPETGLRHYLEGNIVLLDLMDAFGAGTAEEVAALLAGQEKSLLDELADHVKRYPESDEGWDRFRVVCSGPWLSPGADVREMERARVSVRRGVGFLRAFLDAAGQYDLSS